MEETALKNILEAVNRENAHKNVHIVTRKTVQRASWYHLIVAKCIHSQRSAEMTKEDPDIQILLDHAKDLFFSLLKCRTTLADDMLCDFDQTREGFREEENSTCPDLKDKHSVAELLAYD